MTLIKSNKSLATGNKGQIALFVALIFQVLFLFFAMIVNIGLVVHHKINLQNSVDMAAYYGAMKQAELLNSIGHMNYQMRQSWKLLAWRYRILGTMGDTENRHPYEKQSGNFLPGKDVEYSEDTNGNYTRPPFCLAFPPFNDSNGVAVPPNENACKSALDPLVAQRVINLFTVPAVNAGFIGMAIQTQNLTQVLRNSALARCYNIGPFNYLTVGNFLFAYQLDQYARRLVISRISKSMSRNKEDFDDIDGQSVKAGAEETLKRNLTYANKDGQNFSFEMYNGLANGGCGTVPPNGSMELPAPWLSEIRIFPTITYMDLECDSSDNRLGRIPKSFELSDPSNLKSPNNVNMPWSFTNNAAPLLDPQISYLAQNLYLYNDAKRFVLGFEKNPWCQAYVGVKASTKPKIPFAPGDLTLTAEAYAKPFGGRIGPWYNNRWSPGDTESSGDLNSRTDPNASLRVKDISTLQGDPSLFGSPLRLANYSKYIGDQFGLRSWRTMGHYARLIFGISSDPAYRRIAGATTTTDSKLITSNPKALLFDDWYEIAKPIESNIEKDILAWRRVGGVDAEPPIRTAEVTAVAPDQFDLAYYSIEPNFYANYYNRMLNGIIRKLSIDPSFFRPDLGARIGNPTLEKFSVKDQIKAANDISPAVLDFRNKLKYVVLNPVHLLTSWSNKSLFDYDKIDGDFFGNCIAPVISKSNYTDPQTNTALLRPGESLPGECITGGRTGYSVKIVSKDSFFAPQKSGGESSATSQILNPPNDF